MNKFGKVLIVAHDAGGAEILASYVAHNSLHCKFVLEGPAVSVFKRKFGDIQVCTLDEGISDCNWCLCGTGWQSNLEWQAIGECQNSGINVVAFLDHWINYEARFIRNDITHLPNEIWVGDEDAEKIAKSLFLNIPIKLLPNPYFEDIKKQLSEIEMVSKNKDKSDHFLFVCENISDHCQLKYGDPRFLGYTEFDAISFLMDNIKNLSKKSKKVTIRPHPSDPPGKYKTVLDFYGDIAILSEGRTLIEDIVNADIVVGCESVAMVVGLLANKKVISSIPEGGNSCRLPQQKIVHLNKITEKINQ
jgi:hypothetical protein